MSDDFMRCARILFNNVSLVWYKIGTSAGSVLIMSFGDLQSWPVLIYETALLLVSYQKLFRSALSLSMHNGLCCVKRRLKLNMTCDHSLMGSEKKTPAVILIPTWNGIFFFF